jgi:hypothetical protein
MRDEPYMHIMNEQVSPEMQLQIRVSRMLSLGFVLSIVGLGGVGCIIALIIGLRARNIINRNNGMIVGIRMAWWCIAVGVTGAIASLIVMVELWSHFGKVTP